MDIDPDDLSSGSIELDWNEIFLAKLIRKGYSGKNDRAIIDQWFQTICANVVAQNYENEMADPEKRRIVQRTQVGKDRTEIS
jgi:hypothetical protein